MEIMNSLMLRYIVLLAGRPLATFGGFGLLVVKSRQGGP